MSNNKENPQFTTTVTGGTVGHILNIGSAGNLTLPSAQAPRTEINQTFNAPVGVVQTGDNATQVTQNVGMNVTEVHRLLSELRTGFETLPEPKRVEAIEVVSDLEKELGSPQPHPGMVRRCLKAAGEFALDIGKQVTVETLTNLLKGPMGG